jgi:predicted RNA-binding protein with EMAP domain
MLGLAVVLPASAFDFPMTGGSQSTHATTLSMLESTLRQSQEILAMSQQIKDASIAIDPNNANADYIAAMLRLSADIGTMANRIGEMADRIVVTEGLIGEMADRIVVVAGEILTTNTTTQSNLLAAQTNFSAALARSR